MPSRKPKELKSKSRPATGAQTTKPPEPRAPEPPAAKPTLKYASVVNAPVLRDPNGPERLFLVDAMGYIFRAFYAPMPMRMAAPAGMPTKVPSLFSNMVR